MSKPRRSPRAKILAAFVPIVLTVCATSDVYAELQVGAAVVDITPPQLPVIVNGGILGRTVDNVKTKLSARAMVADDGAERVGIVVVDSCVLPRAFLDEAKQLAARQTNIRPNRMLISATHTHSAPSVMDCFAITDPTYVPYLRLRIAAALVEAEANLQPARVGWAVVKAEKFTALRRWILRPDRIAEDVFGNRTVRATMHAGANLDNVTGTSGPEDPDLCFISFQSPTGRPIGLLANFSMHYFAGEQGLSADYYGLFCAGVKSRLAPKEKNDYPPFVAIMSHGCSGDIWRRDYALAEEARYEPTIEGYASEMADLVMDVYGSIEHRDDADLAMAETRLKMNYRVPDQQRLKWARQLVDAMGDREPENSQESYAREQIALHELQSTEVIVQALRIGHVAIATTPTETYALTGLKVKLQSPLPNTMVLDLANGADGYIPPPEQHHLGGYNTWAMRGAGLEIEAEPKITAAAISLLEQVTQWPRRPFRQSMGPAAHAILQAKPSAYWRLDEMSGPIAIDSSGAGRDAYYEPGVVFFLESPHSQEYCSEQEQNRAAHFAGGRMRARLDQLGDEYSVAIWFWNGMPADARPISGWMFSRGHNHALGAPGDHLGVGGTNYPGKLIFLVGGEDSGHDLVVGQTELKRWEWNQVVLVRDGDAARVYLNGNPEPEIDTKAPVQPRPLIKQVFFGGRCDNQHNWEGRLDEIAVFDRALTAEEIAALAVK